MDWTKLKKLKCKICDKGQSSTNPIAKCFECGGRFCYDHIYGGQINKEMKKTDPIRDICSECKNKLSYFNLQ